MNKRQKKKTQSFRAVTNKQRIKNQRSTIRQLYSRIERLEKEKDDVQSWLKAYKDLANKQDLLIDKQYEQIQKLKTPWWKRGTKRGN